MMLYMNGPKDTWQDIETFKEKVNNLEEMQKSVHRHELLQRKNYVGTLVLIMHVICLTSRIFEQEKALSTRLNAFH